MMNIKIHESYRKVAAVCDSELIGRRFEEGKKQLDIRERFYRGEDIEEEILIERMRELAMDDSTFNIVGNKAVSAAMKAGIISENNIGEVGGIKFALVLL